MGVITFSLANQGNLNRDFYLRLHPFAEYLETTNEISIIQKHPTIYFLFKVLDNIIVNILSGRFTLLLTSCNYDACY